MPVWPIRQSCDRAVCIFECFKECEGLVQQGNLILRVFFFFSMSSESHKPGAFKHINKKHKSGRHRKKGTVDQATRGRQDVKTLSKRVRRLQSKLDRRNQAKQIRDNRRNAVLAEKRSFGGIDQPPVLTTVISFVPSFPPEELVGLCCSCDETSIRSFSSKGSVNYLSCGRFKCRYGFTCPNLNRMDDILHSVAGSDVVAFIWPLSGEITTDNETLMSMLLSYGIPATLHFIPGIATISAQKQKEAARKNVQKLIDRWSFHNEKLLHCDNNSDGLNALRTISTMKKKSTILQKRHSHVFVEKAECCDIDGGQCTLKVSGYVRGPFFNVNGLVHIRGCGDFQLSQINIDSDPRPLNLNKKRQLGGMDESPESVLRPDPTLQSSLQSEMVPDPMEGEQTLLEDHELPSDIFEAKKITKKVPTGTSEYQAAWIINEENTAEGSGSSEEEDEESCDDEKNVGDTECAMEEEKSEDGEERCETMTVGSEMDTMGDVEDEEFDMDEVAKYRKERENMQFPDEIDTPIDVPARIRFQKYRALKSFRTSPWDPLENLPISYARIFKFANYSLSKKNALSSLKDENEYCAPHGAFVTLCIAKVPLEPARECCNESPIVVYGLLPHEQKMSVLNMVLRKHPSCKMPIINKQKLIFYVGYRCFEAQPVFSQHTNGDKFKMERFMPSDGAFVASVFAPIMFPPATVLVFRDDMKGHKHLVATGGVLNSDPDRIVLKRVVLSGHPFKIQRRHAVVRYMFFNREDIEWFKPVELHTPRGRRGHIREALGTHGHMKCTFDQQLNAMDSVMMNLYKRVFPKWTYKPEVLLRTATSNDKNEQMEV